MIDPGSKSASNMILTLAWTAAVAAGLAFLAWLGTGNYLVFHSLAELFSIIVAAAIFVIAWNVRETIESGYLLFLGIGFLAVAVIDLLHMLAFEGMQVFPGHGANLATELWIAGRGLEALTLLVAPAFLSRRVRAGFTVLAYSAITAFIILSTFVWDIFPDCYVEGKGLTGFKIAAEYGICLILAGAMIRLLVHRASFRRPVLLLLCASIMATILSELAFTRYAGVYGDFNMIGHLLKIVSVLFIYKAIVETGFRRPYELLYRSLAESEQKFRSLVESNVIGVVFADSDTGAVSDANNEYLRIVGRTRAELESGTLNWKAMTPPEALPAEEAAIGKWISEQGGLAGTYEKEYLRPDGTRVPVIVGARFLDRTRRRMAAFVLDNTVRKQAEESVREARDRAERIAEELARSNSDLEQFGYIVSHDLQEPLRTISGFLTLLKQRNAAGLDEKAEQYIAFAVEGANRMSQMVKDLLEYSRAGKQRLLEPVNVEEVFSEAKSNCVAAIREVQASVTAGDLPRVNGDRRQLVQLFQNLIANSVKFRRPDVTPEVHATAVRDTDQWIFKIRDNGIGIPEDQAGRLFQLFQRLHSRKQYGGNGIGLALCRKIVERHGGRIWVESEAGAGTTISFTLPAIREDQEPVRVLS